MKRNIQKALLCAVSFLLIFSCLFLTVSAEESSSRASSANSETAPAAINDGQMNLDVVFVLDASGSMLNSDPKKVALDAYRLFADLLDDTCGIGYVVYTHEIIAEHEIVNVSDQAALEETKKKMSEIKYDLNGYTDIALGLKRAEDMLTEDHIKKDHRQKAIVLLTDGNTALPKGARTLEDAENQMDTTLMALHDYHIPVYAVGLNYNGKLKKEELERIAEETEGLRYETSSSDELVGIFSDIFGNIYQLEGEEIKLTGGAVRFHVDSDSVFSVSIIVRSPFTLSELDPQVKDPSGKIIPLKGNEAVTVSSTGSYTMIKLLYPAAGDWEIKLSKVDESNCTVTRMDYYSVYIEQNISETVPDDTEMALSASIRNKDGLLDDQTILSTIKVSAVLTDSNNQKIIIPMSSDQSGVYYASWMPAAEGTYSAVVMAETPKFKKYGTAQTVNVLSRAQYEKYLLEGGKPADEAQSVHLKKGEGNSYWVLMVIIGVLALVAAVVAFLIFRKRGKNVEPPPSFEKSEEEKQAEEEEKRRQARANFKPEKPIVMPKATDPKLVDYQIVEHDALENLIKKGPEDAFNANAASYQADAALEALVRKGPDNPFAVGKDEQQYDEDDEYEDEDEGQLDDNTYDYDTDEYEDDEYDDDDDGSSPLGGIPIRKD